MEIGVLLWSFLAVRLISNSPASQAPYVTCDLDRRMNRCRMVCCRRGVGFDEKRGGDDTFVQGLAGFLKQSDEMLVLWDPSWTERLWCLFELAAFLKSRKGREQKLTVRPTLFGPCSIVAFLLVQAACLPLIAVPIDGAAGDNITFQATFSVLGVVFYILGQVAVKFMRNYFHSIETLKGQLRNISFDKTRISCCDMNHVNASGGHMACDRVIVKRCACTWFGSEEAFEDSVRSTVLDTLTTELQFGVFSRTWTMGVAAPVFWTFLDLSASWTFLSCNYGGEFLIEGFPYGFWQLQPWRMLRS